MSDVMTPEQRSRAMSHIKGKDTSIEVLLQKALWHKGIRYRKNYKKLPGTPDIAITKHKIAIFCDGEFWHGKDWEAKKAKISSNRDYWLPKIEKNIARDIQIDRQLHALGWQVLRFWGKDIEKNLEACVSDVQDAILEELVQKADFYAGDESIIEDPE